MRLPFTPLVDNLIHTVNILGSIFYGTLLGLLVVAFFLRRERATPVLTADVSLPQSRLMSTERFSSPPATRLLR